MIGPRGEVVLVDVRAQARSAPVAGPVDGTTEEVGTVENVTAAAEPGYDALRAGAGIDREDLCRAGWLRAGVQADQCSRSLDLDVGTERVAPQHEGAEGVCRGPFERHRAHGQPDAARRNVRWVEGPDHGPVVGYAGDADLPVAEARRGGGERALPCRRQAGRAAGVRGRRRVGGTVGCGVGRRVRGGPGGDGTVALPAVMSSHRDCGPDQDRRRGNHGRERDQAATGRPPAHVQ